MASLVIVIDAVSEPASDGEKDTGSCNVVFAEMVKVHLLHMKNSDYPTKLRTRLRKMFPGTMTFREY